MERVSQAEATLGMQTLQAFGFAVKVVDVALGRELSTADQMKIWALVKEVADGSQTLNVSPAGHFAMRAVPEAFRLKQALCCGTI